MRIEIDQAHGLPCRQELDHAFGGLIESVKIAGVEIAERRQRVERRDRALHFLIDRDAEAARALDVLAVDEILLLLPAAQHELSGEQPEGDEGHEQQQDENRSQSNPACWRP